MPLAIAAPLSIEVESGEGPWAWYLNHRGHSIELLRMLVPWLIALHGIGYAKIKAVKSQLPEMIVALVTDRGDTEHKLLAEKTSMPPLKVSQLYPVAFADVCERTRQAASKPILLQFVSE